MKQSTNKLKIGGIYTPVYSRGLLNEKGFNLQVVAHPGELYLLLEADPFHRIDGGFSTHYIIPRYKLLSPISPTGVIVYISSFADPEEVLELVE